MKDIKFVVGVNSKFNNPENINVHFVAEMKIPTDANLRIVMIKFINNNNVKNIYSKSNQKKSENKS